MGGEAIVDVLVGDYNPCGRLTTSVYPKQFVNRDKFDTGLRSDGGLTYAHYDGKYGELLWEFGHGLTFSNMSTSPRQPLPSKIIQATTDSMLKASIPFEVDVENQNGPAGCYSVLGFVSSAHPEAPRNRKLFDYARVNVETSSAEKASVHLTADTISLV